MKAFILILAFFCIIVAFSQLGQAIPTVVARLQMKMNETSMLNQTQKQLHNKSKLGRGVCSYLITIDTSCLSPDDTRDQIDIKFGDAFGKEVYVSQLDKVVGAKFERCSTTTFRINKPCINRICKLFLIRKGHSGWIPNKVTVEDNKYPAIIFDYNNFLIPDDNTGHGFDFCTYT